MRPVFEPSLVNGPFGEPALFLDILFERRAEACAAFGGMVA